ncbi:MAG: hypothetical protein ABIQ38_03420 [Ilumatobacteraceae bacterium]
MLSQLELPIDVPRAHCDPINSATQALVVFSLAISRPLRPETLVLMMDTHHRGIGLFALNNGGNLRSLIDYIVGKCAATNSARALAIATIRPHLHTQSNLATEWTSSREICQRAGVQLVDWFVVGRQGVHCPRINSHGPDEWHS